MRYDWVLDVLTDLKAFAQANGLVTLSEHLDETLSIAREEIATRRGDHDEDEARRTGPLPQRLTVGDGA